jgi:hypothetical protein
MCRPLCPHKPWANDIGVAALGDCSYGGLRRPILLLQPRHPFFRKPNVLIPRAHTSDDSDAASIALYDASSCCSDASHSRTRAECNCTCSVSSLSWVAWPSRDKRTCKRHRGGWLRVLGGTQTIGNCSGCLERLNRRAVPRLIEGTRGPFIGKAAGKKDFNGLPRYVGTWL